MAHQLRVMEQDIRLERAQGPWSCAAACTAQGPRTTNEDSHVLCCNGLDDTPSAATNCNGKVKGVGGLFDDLPGLVSGPALPAQQPVGIECLFAVLDGHGGASVSQLCAQRLAREVHEQLDSAGRGSKESRAVAMESVCLGLDRYLRIRLGAGGNKCGTTCVFSFVWPKASEPDGFGVILTNLGDSRGLVLCADTVRGRYALNLAGETADHTPDLPVERLRIVNAGAQVFPHPQDRRQAARIDGRMGCSRALGDFDLKDDAALLPEQQKVSPIPDVYEFSCGRGDVIVLACDGVFDVLESEDVADIVQEALKESGGDPGVAAQAVINAALSDVEQQDNVTCVVAILGGRDACAGSPSAAKRLRKNSR